MDALLDNLPLLRDGFLTTLRLTLVSGAFALLLGTLLGAFRVSPVPTLRGFGTVYVELLRNTPLTLVFFFFVFAAPQIGIELPFDISALVALSLYTAAFVCEAVRSGVNTRRPTPGGGRDGRHPGGDPDSGVVLARRHL